MIIIIAFLKKITSRKFIISLSSVLSGLFMLFGFAESTAQTITGAILTIAGVGVYVISEAICDSANTKNISAEIEKLIKLINSVGVDDDEAN